MPEDPQPKPSKSEPKAATPASDTKPKPAGAPGDPIPANELTPEEQMERFEKSLKEDDWGHQPC